MSKRKPADTHTERTLVTELLRAGGRISLLMFSVCSVVFVGCCSSRTLYLPVDHVSGESQLRVLYDDSTTRISFYPRISLLPLSDNTIHLDIGGRGPCRLDSIDLVVRNALGVEIKGSPDSGFIEYRAFSRGGIWNGVTDGRLRDVNEAERQFGKYRYEAIFTIIHLPVAAADLPDTVTIELKVGVSSATTSIVAKDAYSFVRRTICVPISFAH